MRELSKTGPGGIDQDLVIEVMDEPGAGGASHDYKISYNRHQLGYIHFQEGPVKEGFVNGITIESLLAICADRLTSFQAGEYACDENGSALYSLQQAQKALNIRTQARLDRGVEGTSQH
jgi:hypothetical protein